MHVEEHLLTPRLRDAFTLEDGDVQFRRDGRRQLFAKERKVYVADAGSKNRERGGDRALKGVDVFALVTDDVEARPS